MLFGERSWVFVVKPVPILGTLVLLGAIVQIVFGFQVVADVEAFRGVHILFGIVGLVLVAVLAVIAFRSKSASIYSKLIIVVLTIVVLLQVGLGLQLLGGEEGLVVSHEMNGFLIVFLSLAMGGVTFMSAKKHSMALWRVCALALIESA
jgi:hypothetical protein